MSTLERKVITHTVGDGSYVLDSRYFPLLISGWIGDLSHELVEHFFKNRAHFTNYAKQSAAKVIQISDISRMGVPTASVRRAIADNTLQADIESACMHEYVVVIPSAIMRGVVTAVSWITGEKGAPTSNAPTLEAAIERITKTFQELGIDFEPPSKSYTLPKP